MRSNGFWSGYHALSYTGAVRSPLVFALLLAASCNREGVRGIEPRARPILPEAPSGPGPCVAPSTPSIDFYGASDFPSAACRTRAGELLAKMTARERVAQMVQLGRNQVPRPDDIAAWSLGSVLSGGGSSPEENNPT